MSSKSDVVIIGGGVIGCSIAYHLAKQGVRSQIVEMDAVAARASGKAWAIFSYPALFFLFEGGPTDQLFSTPKGSLRPFLELFWLGYHRLPDVALDLQEKGGINIGYGELSYVKVACSESEESEYKTFLSFMRNEGFYEGSWAEADDLKAIYPDINPQARGGLIFPCLQVEPYKYTLGLAQAAERMGATVRQGEAVGFRHSGSRVTSVVLATGTEVKADVVVLAMGPWISQGASWLGQEIPVLLNREECLRLEVSKRFPPFGLRIPTVAIVPKVDGSVILGLAGTADLQKGFGASLTTEEAKNAILTAATGLLLSRLEDAKVVEHRGDLEGWSPAPNHIQPVLGRLPAWENAYVAARLGTLGMAMSLGVGQVMADVIIEGGDIPKRVANMMELLSPSALP